ncbi:MAG: TonB-dependent receptor [Bacteroidota bacterium]
MMDQLLGARQKALKINLSRKIYGSFAEIGAGQEVASIFFKAGGASGTIAKTISAYDMTFSDAIYGIEESGRYVVESRLTKMLNREYNLVEMRLGEKRGADTTFFAFANTVVTINYQKTNEAHGWVGLRFQLTPRGPFNDAIIHVRMHDNNSLLQQQALGVIGVNLIYACFYFPHSPEALLKSLMDELSPDNIEIDMVRITGPDFPHVDNRLLSLQLVKNGFTNAALFGPDGNVLQPSEALYKKNILALRGRFRPVTHVNMDMLKKGTEQFFQEPDVDPARVVVLSELTLSSLRTGDEIDEKDFLDRVDILCSLGQTVLISNYQEYYKLVAYLSQMTRLKIGLVLGFSNLEYIFEEKYYESLPGGILESFATLFSRKVKLFVYPMQNPETNEIRNCKNFKLPPHLVDLYEYLIVNDKLEDLTDYDTNLLYITSDHVLAAIKAGEPGWEEKVPAEVAHEIKAKALFGYTGHPGKVIESNNTPVDNTNVPPV